MLTDFVLRFPKTYIVTGRCDMRKSIDGLAAIIEQKYKLDPFQPAVFIFCGRRSDRIKLLFWDSDGWCLCYKRLENSSRYQWPRKPEEVRRLDERQVRWLLECIDIEQPKASRKFMPSSVL